MLKTRKKPAFQESKLFELNLGGSERRIDGGLNTADLPYALDTTQSPDMVNMWYYEGALTKRWGQEVDGTLSSGAGIDSAVVTSTGHALLCSGGAIWHYTPSDGVGTLLYTLAVPEGADDAPSGRFIRYGERVYFINGNEYLVYNGYTIAPVTPHVPTIYTGCEPKDGTGSRHSGYNLLTAKYKVSFSSDGESLIYSLPGELSIAAQSATAVVNGTAMAEGAGFTLNRTAKTVAFAAAPGAGYDNVVLTLYGDGVTDSGVMQCMFGIVYGGESRMVLGGNGTNRVYGSEPYDPSYFPAENAIEVGGGDYVTGFGRQYNILAVFKPGEIASLSMGYSGGRSVLTPSVLNPFIGCDMPDSIANIGNRIVFANRAGGVYIITSTSHDTERNVVQLSRNINSRLLEEEGLESACAVVMDGKYWLCVGEHVYLWDNDTRPLVQTRGADAQRALAWYYFEGIPAGAFFVAGRRLYYGRRGGAGESAGVVVAFRRSFDDFGAGIPAHWRSAVLDFDHANRYKSIERIWIITRSNYAAEAEIKYMYDERSGDVAALEGAGIQSRSFSWPHFSWSDFTWAVPGFFKTFTRRPRRRRVIFFSLLLSGSEAGCDLSIVDLTVQYRLEYRIK